MRSYALGALTLLGLVNANAHAPPCSTTTTAVASPTSTAIASADSTPIFTIYATNDAGDPFLPATASLELLYAYNEISVEYYARLVNNTIPSNTVWSLDPQTGHLDVVNGPGSTTGQRLIYSNGTYDPSFLLTIKPGDTDTLARMPFNGTPFTCTIDSVSLEIVCQWLNATRSAQFGVCSKVGNLQVADPDYNFGENQCYPVTLYAKPVAVTPTTSSTMLSTPTASTTPTFMLYGGNDDAQPALPGTFYFDLEPATERPSATGAYYPAIVDDIPYEQNTIWSLDPQTGYIDVVSGPGNSTGQRLTCPIGFGYMLTAFPADISSVNGLPCICEIDAYSSMVVCRYSNTASNGQFATCTPCDTCGLYLDLTPEGAFLPDFDCDVVSLYAKLIPGN